MKNVVTRQKLRGQAQVFAGRGGVSEENRRFGFCPAFLDKESGEFVLSCNAEGALAAVHLFDGLPAAWVALRDGQGRPIAIKASIIAGFVRDGYFFTREQAAQLVQWELDKAAL